MGLQSERRSVYVCEEKKIGYRSSLQIHGTDIHNSHPKFASSFNCQHVILADLKGIHVRLNANLLWINCAGSDTINQFTTGIKLISVLFNMRNQLQTYQIRTPSVHALKRSVEEGLMGNHFFRSGSFARISLMCSLNERVSSVLKLCTPCPDCC